jgi:hypothetical protein
MATQAKDIRLVCRKIGTKHVVTSPDVPELHLSHADEGVALADVQPALDALDRMRIRMVARS